MTHGSRTSLLYFAPHHGFPLPPGFAKVTGTPLAPGFPFPASAFLTCPHSSVIPQYRNLHLLSIGYDSRPRLRPRLTQSRSALLWKPWIFGHKDSHLILATHSGILSSMLSLVPLNWEIPCRYTLFKGHVSRNCPPVCRSITNGTSGLLLAGRNMMNYPIRKTC